MLLNNHNQLDDREELRKEELKVKLALENLLSNEDFKLVIIDKFINDVHNKSSLGVISTDEKIRINTLEELKSVGYLKRYLENILSGEEL